MPGTVDKSVGGGLNHAFTTPNHNGNLYNTENDKPVKEKTPKGVKEIKDKGINEERLHFIRVGMHINYSLGKGIIVSKRGPYLSIANDDSKHVDTVHVGEAWQDGERMTYDRTWDTLAMETRNTMLVAARVPVNKFINRTWVMLPRDLQDELSKIAKGAPGFTEGSGGPAGREPGISRDSETQSYRGTDKLVNDPPKKVEKPAKGVAKAFLTDSDYSNAGLDKSDVEHGLYGGVNTNTPFEASEDYEEDKREGNRKQIPYQDHDAAEQKPQDGYNAGGSAYLHEHGPRSKGATCSICGGKHDTEEHDKDKSEGSSSTGTSGITNPVFGDGPQRKKMDEIRNVANKYSARYGPRKASPDEIKKFLEKGHL